MRYRDLETGVWLTRDPAGFVDGPNLYAYVRQNPWSKFDPDGLNDMMAPGYDPGSISDEERRGIQKAENQHRSLLAGAAVGVAELALNTASTIVGMPEAGSRMIDGVMPEGLQGDPYFQGGRLLGNLTGAVLGAKAGTKTRDGKSGTREPSCFLAETPVLTPAGLAPIAKLRVGQRVCVPEDFSHGDASTAVDPATWVCIQVQLRQPEREWDLFEITLLRPLDWLSQHSEPQGSRVWIEIEELGARGWAELVSVTPCPPLEQGTGRVVTATMKHLNRDVRKLRLANGEVIGVTGLHKLFSADRGDWVRTMDLFDGETLRTASGREQVGTLTPNPGAHLVFNVEVEKDHCYFVGRSGVLAHNGCAPEGDVIRMRHYTNRKGSNGVEETQMIKAGEHNSVYGEPAKKKPVSSVEAEQYHRLPEGRGRDYIETDVPTERVEYVPNPLDGRREMTVRGDVPLSGNAKIVRRRK